MMSSISAGQRTMGAITAAMSSGLPVGTTREFPSLASFSAFLEHLALEEPEKLVVAAGAASIIVRDRVRKVFGDKSKLAPLAQSTMDRRAAMGDAQPDRPLLIDGHLLRDSIEAAHESLGPTTAVGGVGSSEQILLWHETGAGHYPARPAFAIGVYEALPEVRQVIRALLRPGARLSLGGREFLEE